MQYLKKMSLYVLSISEEHWLFLFWQIFYILRKCGIEWKNTQMRFYYFYNKTYNLNCFHIITGTFQCVRKHYWHYPLDHITYNSICYLIIVMI